MQIPQTQIKAIKKSTMDFSDSMYAIIKEAFSIESIATYCFHMLKRLCYGLDEMCMRFKCKTVNQTK